MNYKKLPDSLQKAISRLIYRHPFFATILLKREYVLDPGCKTAWTDGEQIGFDPEFIEKEDLDGLIFTLAHEVMHITNRHHARMENKDAEIWNQAGDYAINPTLLQCGLRGPKSIKLLNDFRFYGKCTEDIYRILKKEAQDKKNQNQSKPGKNPDQNKPGQSQPNQGTPSNDKPDDSSDSDGSGDKDQSFGDVRPCKAGTESKEEAEIAVETVQAETVAKKQGKMPGALSRQINNVPPNKDWKEDLARFASVISANDYSFNEVNMRYAHSGIILPEMHSIEVGNIVVACDTSGSISAAEVAKMISELFNIIENILGTSNVQELPVIYCDSQIQGVEYLSAGDIAHPKGGGGTNFIPPFDYVEKNNLAPAGLVYITDGYCNSLPANPGYPVLWALFAHNPSFNPPFGEITYISPE
jgi:predicted metal-dependent peptidase